MARPTRRRATGFGLDDVAEGMSEAGRARGGAAQPAGEQAAANVANLTEHAVRRAHEWARQTRGTAERLNQRVGEAGTDLQETMRAGANVRDAASAAYDTAAETLAARRGRDRPGRPGDERQPRRQPARACGEFLQEQPLVLAGLGLAIGGLLGASLPSSEAEDRLMGEASDAAKSEARSFAQEQVDKGRHVAEQAWSAAKPEMDKAVRPGDIRVAWQIARANPRIRPQPASAARRRSFRPTRPPSPRP